MVNPFYNWETFFRSLDNWGLTDVLLPFLLIFTVVFAILQKTHVLGEKKNYNIIVSFVLAFMVVILHVTKRYPPGTDVVEILIHALPQVSLIIVAVIMLLILIGVWGAEAEWAAGNKVTGGIVLLSAVAIIYVFGASAGWWHGWSWINQIFGADSIAIVVMILVFALIVWFVTSDERQSKGDGFMSQLGNMFRKK